MRDFAHRSGAVRRRALWMGAVFLLVGSTCAFAQIEKFANNAASTLATTIVAGDTSLTVATGEGSRFPTITGSDFFYVTLEDVPFTKREIVKVTARSADVFTIVRAQQSTTATGFSSGSVVAQRVTRDTLVGLQAITTTSLNMSGETKRRFTITDATVSTSSKIAVSIQRPTVAAVDDFGWTYNVEILTLAAGSFDVLVRVDDPDADIEPPTETITLVYIVR